MKRLLAGTAAAILTASTAQAQWVEVLPPPFIYQAPPIVVQPPPVVVQAPPPPVCVVNLPPWEWLNLRTYPNGWIIGSMPPGTPLTVLGVNGRWGFVQTPLGYTGWAFLPYTLCS